MGGLTGVGSVTESSLRAQGIEFRRTGPGQYQSFGPEDRLDLRDALRAELARRTDAMAAEIEKLSKKHIVGPLLIAPVPARRSGLCSTCGDELEPNRGGMCALCVIALGRALVRTGRLAA